MYIKNHRLKGYASFKAAFEEGCVHSNLRRRQKNLPPFLFYFLSSDLQEPGDKEKKQLILPGIQSCHGVTFTRGKGVFNHIFPDVEDRSEGIPLNTVRSGPYTRFDKNGNPLRNFLLPKYPEVGDVQVVDADHIAKQCDRRQHWKRLIEAKRQRQQQLLPLIA